MTKANVLVVGDEKDLLELISYNLGKEGYRVECATSGEEALRLAVAKLPDLVILDLMLPSVDGLEVCKAFKADPKTRPIPIIMLTAKTEESDIVTGLELGADDYVTKPFSPRVLLARVKTVLRRKSTGIPAHTETLRIGELIIDPGRHEILARGQPVPLTLTEFRVLHLLARRPGWVFTRQRIVDGAGGEGAIVTERSVDVHIVSLRKKLGACGHCIETVRGVGYRLKDE
jgi:two-component system phosphate regulon response regulator PhoB